jgi:Lon protease-like protein
MLRRCLESPQHRFGMVSPPRAGTGAADYGTMLEIRSVQVLPDGRSVVETWGTHRFRIVERGTLDGYMVARIEHIDDYAAELPEPALRVRAPADAELMHMCREFLEQLRRGTAPWVVQRLNNTYGPMPTEPAAFSFWMALVRKIASLGVLGADKEA